MATQRLTVMTLSGRAAVAVADNFNRWRSVPHPDAVDRLCAAVREHALSLPVVYFAEWMYHWLMGDLVPGRGAVDGRRFQATCLTPEEATNWACQCGDQFAEQGWLASRLREAAAGWGQVAEPYAVVVVREAFGASITDDDVRAAANQLPMWLSGNDPETDRKTPVAL